VEPIARKLLALLANIRLGWTCLALTNTLAYCGAVLTARAKDFIAQIPKLK